MEQTLKQSIINIQKIIEEKPKDKDGKIDKKSKPLTESYSFTNLEYFDYFKIFFEDLNVSKILNEKYLNNHKEITIIDLMSGSGILTLSLLNVLYNNKINYKIILNDKLYSEENNVYINKLKNELNSLNSGNINIELTSYDITKEESFQYFNEYNNKNIILIANPLIAKKTNFPEVHSFLNNENIQKIFNLSDNIVLADSVTFLLEKNKNEFFNTRQALYLNEIYGFDDKITDEELKLLNIILNNENYLKTLKLSNIKDLNIETISNYLKYKEKKLLNIFFFYEKNENQKELLRNEYYYYFNLCFGFKSSKYTEINNNLKLFKSYLKSINIEILEDEYKKLKGKI
jgi:hypothetical protein